MTVFDTALLPGTSYLYLYLNSLGIKTQNLIQDSSTHNSWKCVFRRSRIPSFTDDESLYDL